VPIHTGMEEAPGSICSVCPRSVFLAITAPGAGCSPHSDGTTAEARKIPVAEQISGWVSEFEIPEYPAASLFWLSEP
jgi:hypothetical protein